MMRNLMLFLLFASPWLFVAQAIVSRDELPSLIISTKLRNDAQNSLPPDYATEMERQNEEARVRAERIHSLPPHLIAVWVAGQIDASNLDEAETVLRHQSGDSPPSGRSDLLRQVGLGVAVLLVIAIAFVGRKRPLLPLKAIW